MKETGITRFKNDAVCILASIGIGSICTVICYSLINGEINETAKCFIIWIIASALFGAVSIIIFKNERLALPAAFAIHCVVCFIITISAAFLCKFDVNGRTILTIYLPMFIIIYGIIFCVTYFVNKAEADKANQTLKNREK